MENRTLILSENLVFSTVMDIYKKSLLTFKNISNPIIDFKKVSYCDSSSLALLIEWQRFAKQQHQQITFIHVPKQLIKIAQVACLEKILKLL